jgi:TRAP-type C4-dicarboxylate transport system permease small subunit
MPSATVAGRHSPRPCLIQGEWTLTHHLIGWLDRLERFITAVTAAVMILLSVLICWQVFSRYVLNSSPFWIEEISVVSMMWIGLLGAAGCVWTESHMSLELVVSRLPEKIRVWLRSAVDIVVGLFSCFLFERGIFLVQRTMSGTLATLSIPLGYTYLVLPIAGGLMTIFAFSRAVHRLARHYVASGGSSNV